MGGERREDKKDPFEPTGELKGGYDMGMARAYALDHAKKHVGEYVGKGKERRPLIWDVEQSRYDEDAECFEVASPASPKKPRCSRRASGSIMCAPWAA